MTGLGDRLQSARRLAGISAQVLADRLPDHISRAVITNVENGRKVDLPATDLLAVSRALNVSVLELMPELGLDFEREAYKAGYDAAVNDMRTFSALRRMGR